MKKINQTIAKAVRVEFNHETDQMYLVFEIVDEDFKQRIKKDWMQDIEVKLSGRELVEDE